LSDVPTVTVLIPARNEEADIERCLRAVLAQDHLHHRMEIIVVDGASTDRTADIAGCVLAEGDIPWRIVCNPIGTTPTSLNAGLAVAAGMMLCRVDARSIVPPPYVRLCAEILAAHSQVAVVGGAQVASARDDSCVARGIARGLNNRFAMGGSRYRAGSSSGAADTVYLGAFRTAQLRAVGGWDKFFTTNQDYELNRRLSATGIVWFDSRLEVLYLPRRTLRAIGQQYHRFGRWKVRYWRRTGDSPQRRQIVLLIAGTAALLIGAAAVLVLVLLPFRVRLVAALALLLSASVGLLTIDALGAPEANVALPTRVVSAATVALVACGWLSGVAREALHAKTPEWA